MKKEKLIILGSGPAGCTAAIYAARANLSPLVLEGKHPGGQLMETTIIENFPGFPENISAMKLLQNMKTQAENFGANFLAKNIVDVNFSENKNFQLVSDTDDKFVCESVILALGARARWLNLGKNEERYLGKGYSACAICDGAFFRDRTVAVVGGGDSACEEATFLTKFAKKVYLIHRRDELRASTAMQNKVQNNEKIEILWNKNVTELIGENLLEKVELTDSLSEEKTELAINGLFVALGRTPDTQFLQNKLKLANSGHIITKGDKETFSTETNIPGVFACGDSVDWQYRQAIVAAGGGCMAAIDAERFLTD